MFLAFCSSSFPGQAPAHPQSLGYNVQTPKARKRLQRRFDLHGTLSSRYRLRQLNLDTKATGMSVGKCSLSPPSRTAASTQFGSRSSSQEGEHAKCGGARRDAGPFCYGWLTRKKRGDVVATGTGTCTLVPVPVRFV